GMKFGSLCLVYSSGGVRSSANSGTCFAPTRDGGSPIAFTVRVRSPTRATMISPGRTSLAGLLGCPFTVTCPALIASEALDRVLKTRIAQSHESKRMPQLSRPGALAQCGKQPDQLE